MTIRLLLLASVLAFCPIAYAESDSACEGIPRISDEEALRIAKEELIRRSPKFDPSAFEISVEEDACDLRVIVNRKDRTKLGGRSTLVLSRSGEVKQFWGGM